MGKKKQTVEVEQDEKKLRIAIVSSDHCKPKTCRQECKKCCPRVEQGTLCVEVSHDSKISHISETLCTGCGICVKRCPFKAISIVNLPRDLSGAATHRHGHNGFKLHRLPIPRAGQVLGLLGSNGMGKSTALQVLAGRLKPNLGRVNNPPDWQEILQHFRGGGLQRYFKDLLEDRLKIVMKPQHITDQRKLHVKVCDILDRVDAKESRPKYCQELELSHLVEQKVELLSGGELQRLAIATSCLQHGQVYIFDEPSSFLDVRQRLAAAKAIRSLQTVQNYLIVVEHDLAVLDFMSDFLCCLWGSAGAYGVVTMPFSVRQGINVFLDGFIPTENLRVREAPLSFKVRERVDPGSERTYRTEYPEMSKQLGSFALDIKAGSFASSEIVVLLGQNGCGKTTFIEMLAGRLLPDNVVEGGMPKLKVSYKPQEITAKFEGTVEELLLKKIRTRYLDPHFQTEVVKPMLIDAIAKCRVQTLSGGEKQRVALVLTLGQDADIYLLDEPSADLDVEQRVAASRVMRRFFMHGKKAAFVVEHDFMMATYLADRVIVYEGQPGIRCVASEPMSLLEGMNRFLAQLEVTFRRDPHNHRPRINKPGSSSDVEQKKSGSHSVLEE